MSVILSTPRIQQSSGVLTVYGSAIIDTEAEIVFQTLLDFERYPEWNTFTPRIVMKRGTKGQALAKGDRILLEAKLRSLPSLDMPLTISDVDVQNHTICWTSGGPWTSAFLFTERVQKVSMLSKRQCKFETYETMKSPLAYIVRYLLQGRLNEAFQKCADDLKAFCEKSR